MSRDSLLLFLLLAGFMSLLQFPFSAPVYFCLRRPAVFLPAAIAALTHSGLHRGAFPTTILAIFVLFGLGLVDNQFFWSLGIQYQPDPVRRSSIRTVPPFASSRLNSPRIVRAVSHRSAREKRFRLCRSRCTRGLFPLRQEEPDSVRSRLPRPVRHRAGQQVAGLAPSARGYRHRHQSTTAAVRSTRAPDGARAAAAVSEG